MKFSQVCINRDTLAEPICDRHLPNHPKEIYGLLPYWYFRTRFSMYGLPEFDDLILRGLRRKPELNEGFWHKVSEAKGIEIQEKFFPIGALLPYHPIFKYMHPPLTVAGEKIDPTQPWAFKYVE